MYDLENKSISVFKISLDRNSFSRKPYASHKHKICAVNKGRGIWLIGDKTYSVGAGDTILLNNRLERVFKEVSPLEGIELIIVEFEPQFIFNTLFQQIFYNLENEFDCKISGNKAIVSLLHDMEREAQDKLANYRIITGAKLVEILSHIGRHYDIKDSGNTRISVDMYKALDYINNNYTGEISLDSAASIVHMSSTGFSKYFSRCLGIGFSQYIMRKRINHAIYLLERSEKTVLDIALECGFNNSASFYKAFKKITHRAPNYYKNQKVNHNI